MTAQPLPRRLWVQLLISLVVVLLVLVAIASSLIARNSDRATPADSAGSTDVAANARVLDAAPNAKATVTEFLDFECEACGAMYPVVEQLRRDYDGQVAFTFRYFPLPGHRNSMNAALAVEAAHRQGQLEPMFTRLFQTQQQWGEAQQSKASVFRAAAADLGLDMARFDRDVASDSVRARVESDVAMGRSLGIQGTPTFYVDGEQVSLTAASDLEAAITRATGG